MLVKFKKKLMSFVLTFLTVKKTTASHKSKKHILPDLMSYYINNLFEIL